jgi:hypothetical protein
VVFPPERLAGAAAAREAATSRVLNKAYLPVLRIIRHHAAPPSYIMYRLALLIKEKASKRLFLRSLNNASY